MWLVCLISSSSECCCCWFSCWIYLTVGRTYWDRSMTSWEDIVSVFVSVILSPWSKNRSCHDYMPPFFCDVNWPLKDLFKQRNIMWKWVSDWICINVWLVCEREINLMLLSVCQCCFESMCTCVCLYVNKPRMLLGGRNRFILVDSYFGKLLPSAH